MQVKFKKLHNDAVLPSYAKQGDAGMDLTATTRLLNTMNIGSGNSEDGCIEYGTGLAVEIPEGFVGLLFPRSSLCKHDLILTNHVGVIDSGYRGEIKFKFKLDNDNWTFKEDNGNIVYYQSGEHETRDWGLVATVYEVGDRIGQLLILPYPQIETGWIEELSESERGAGGYGSSGK